MFERFRLELNRHKQRPSLEAVAAACALVATADGEVSFSERARLDTVIESLSQLRLFDPHEVVDAFDEHVAQLADDDDGVAAMLKVISAGTRAEGAADLLLRISAVSEPTLRIDQHSFGLSAAKSSRNFELKMASSASNNSLFSLAWTTRKWL